MLDKFIKSLEHKISGGSDFLWKCFGNNAKYLDFEALSATASLVYDAKTQTVYKCELFLIFENSNKDSRDDQAYMWINPEYKDAYLKECDEKNVKYNFAYDDLQFIEFTDVESFLQECRFVFKGLCIEALDEEEKTEEVELDLDNDTILHLALEAHRRDITLNKMIEVVLKNAIEENEKQDKY